MPLFQITIFSIMDAQDVNSYNEIMVQWRGEIFSRWADCVVSGEAGEESALTSLHAAIRLLARRYKARISRNG